MTKINLLIVTVLASIALSACSPEPVDIKFDKELYVLESPSAELQIKATAVDANGTPIKDPVAMTFFCPNLKIIKVTNDGKVTAVSSGEDEVEVEIVGKDIKKNAKVKVEIASDIKLTHEKLRLWTGQVKNDVSAWVVSEKDAYIKDYKPTWTSEDPTVVSVKDIKDPTGSDYPRSYVEMVGKKSGNTTISATYNDLTQSISVSVFDEDEEVDLSGQRKPKKGEAAKTEEEKE
ncbi:MAG: hypothetical protein JXR91_02475 [Deltaproteobacteria bacterium]|nr:hypothetical protein [Deltaproteobacteria bacterium]